MPEITRTMITILKYTPGQFKAIIAKELQETYPEFNYNKMTINITETEVIVSLILEP